MTARPANLIALSLALALFGCGHTEPDAYQNTAASSQTSLFTVPAAQMEHLQLYRVQPVAMERQLRLTGSVAYNQLKSTPVIAAIGGPVTHIEALPGQHVKRGQPLLQIASPDFGQLRANYLKASDASRVADKNYARAQDLFSHHAIAEKDLLDAESASTQAGADLQNAEQALRAIGFADPSAVRNSTVSREVPLPAPISGEVVELLVNPGQLLTAGQTQCFTISDMNSVWVLVNVYQSDLPYVHVGDPVTIQTDAYPQSFHGTISYVGAALDPGTRTVQARIVTENPHEELKKDMFVTATVTAGKIANALTVPDAALLRNAENQSYVYVSVADGKFAQRLVSTGLSSGGQTEITAGLKAGDRVVGQGALFLQFANSLQQ